MTNEEALKCLMEAVNQAIIESPDVNEAVRVLRENGMHLESIEAQATLRRRDTQLAPNDIDFLKSLRIHPDVEVRE